MKNDSKKILVFCRPDNKRGVLWNKKIKSWIKKNYPKSKLVESNPDIVIALGGDGSMLEAARTYGGKNVVIMGLNLGRVGFLASIRSPKDFISGLRNLFAGNYSVVERMMLHVSIKRNNKEIRFANVLNDVVLQSPLSMAEIEVIIGNHPAQYIRGTGVLVSTATGSTAFNLSAHGPIVMPDIHCMIVTELLDHNIPTPSIVIKPDTSIKLKLTDFRTHGMLINTATKEPADVFLSCDGEKAFPLKKGDEIIIRKSSQLVRFIEFDKNYFFKSIREKFSFK